MEAAAETTLVDAHTLFDVGASGGESLPHAGKGQFPGAIRRLTQAGAGFVISF